MNIGQLGKRTGVSAKTIRYYEDTGLIPKPRRQSNGYRVYSEKDVEILKFIHRSRELGFSMEEVTELLSLWSNKRRSSRSVKALALQHVTEVEERIAKLEEMRQTLLHLISECHGDDRPDCPILNELASAHDLAVKTTDKGETIMKRTYKVNGMTCGHCAQAVKSAIENLSSAAAVDVDLADGTVTIDNVPAVDGIKKAVEDAGYEFAGEI